MLRVQEESSDEEVKQAYFNLAKEYHPDSTTSTADPKKFSQIEQAYRAILVSKFKFLHESFYRICLLSGKQLHKSEVHLTHFIF